MVNLLNKQMTRRQFQTFLARSYSVNRSDGWFTKIENIGLIKSLPTKHRQIMYTADNIKKLLEILALSHLGYSISSIQSYIEHGEKPCDYQARIEGVSKLIAEQK